MTKFEPLTSLAEENLPFRCIRFAAVCLILWLVYRIGSGIESLETRSVYLIVATVLFWYLPRAVYTRYKRVILNEELGSGWKARKISERLVYATKKQLSESFVFVLTGLMAWYGLLIQSPEALKTLTVSAMVTMAATILFMMPPLKKFYKEDRYPSVFPFYRRSFAAILAGLVCFVMAFLQFRPHLDGETAFKTMAVSVTQTPDSFTGLLASLRDTMGIWAAMMNYGLSFAEGTTWYALTKAALIALPYGVLGAHFGIILGVLTLPGRSVKALMGKQHWIKTDRGVIKRYWKTVALPIFLIGFFGAGVYYGYPYYVKYQDKIILTAGTSEKAGKIDVIESQYYKTGTVKSIENEKTHAVNRLKGLINNAVNEVNIVFSEEEERLETFLAWFTEERKTRRFPVGNELLKETYKNSMDLRNLNLKLQNIRKELGQEASRVYSDLGIYIDTLMKNNVITISDDDEKNIGRKFSMEEINTMKLPGGNFVPVRATFRMKTQLPEITIDLLDDFDNAASPWYKEVLSKEEQSLENDIFGDLSDSGEDSGTGDQKSDSRNGKDARKQTASEKTEKMSEAEAELLGLAPENPAPGEIPAESTAEDGNDGTEGNDASEGDEADENVNPLSRHGRAVLAKEKNLVIQALYDGLGIPFHSSDEPELPEDSGRIEPEENEGSGLDAADERELFESD